MIIILIGYMGSGKSTIGQKLSKIVAREYLDLDTYIEQKEGLSIPELFKTKGEIYFRNIESRYLNEVLLKDNSIVSVGGGTPCYGINMKAITSHEKCISIYLKASIPQLTERLRTEKSSRPLISHLQSDEALSEFIGKHLFERSRFYNEADIVISVDKKPVDDIVEELVMQLF